MKINRIKQIGLFILTSLLITYCSFYLYNKSSQKRYLVQSQKALIALHENTFSEQSIWEPTYFQKNTLVKEKIQNFEQGKLCNILKRLDNKNLPYNKLVLFLKQADFNYQKVPLTVHPDPNHTPKEYLKRDNTVTQNLNDPDIVFQEIYSNKEGCVVRFKKDGFPNNKRKQPHSTKAILIKANFEPTYENEAFKITWDGQPVPKGPNTGFGLKEITGTPAEKAIFIDCVMEEAHPDLKF